MKLLTIALLIAGIAVGQSLPAGYPTDLQVAHVTKQNCAGILQYIFPGFCKQQVDVKVASSNPSVTAFAIAVLYTDKDGVVQVDTQVTATREDPQSSYFTAVFFLDNIIIKSVEAVPLTPDSSGLAVVTNVP